MTPPKKPTNSTALARTLTDSNALPALVETLEPAALQQLVEAVGIEDSGTLIAHASPTQIAHLVDESIWASARPGEVESLSVPELLKWFDLWLDLGDTFIAEKLYELGEEFCALSLAKLVVVSTQSQPDELFEAIGDCLVSPRYDDEWDTVKNALLALWSDYPDFTEAVLNRLDFQHSILRMTGEDDRQRTLEEDASFARESRKEAQGFVGAATAGAFLAELVHADLDDLSKETAYDAHTLAYFTRRTRPHAQTESSVPDTRSARHDESSDDELNALQAELDNFEVYTSDRMLLLTAPEHETTRDILPLRTTLSSLITDLDQFTQYSDELVYLSNLVKSQVVSDKEKLSAANAANLVMATANLGGSYLLWLDGKEKSEKDPAAFVATLASAAGIVRLFRIGWSLLNHLPTQTASRVTQTLTGEHAKQIWATKAWLRDEIELLINEPSLIDVVRAGDFDAAKETIKILAIALKPQAISALNLLIDAVPRLPKSMLNNELSHQEGLPGYFYIAFMQDLVLIDRFLNQMENDLNS